MNIIGIISTILFAVYSIATPLGDVRYQKRSIELGFATAGARTVVDVLQQNYALITTFVIVTPLLTLFAWNFLTKRNASDFYHSLPYTRLCTFLSRAMAIVSWQLIIILVSALCSSVIYLTNQQYLIVSYGMLFRTYLVIFICNLLCCSAISIACMLTGTLFSNICVSGLIIFFPRFIMLICNAALTGSVPFVVGDHMIPLIGQNTNIITGIVFNFFRMNNSTTEMMLSVSGNVYTFVLAIIYFVIAGVLYHNRKSEAAGKGAVTKAMQCIIRVMIGFTICSFGIINVVGEMRSTEPNTATIINQLIITVVIASIVIIIYECINTKTIRGAIKSIPSIAISIAAGAIALVGLNLWINQALEYRPDANEIKLVAFRKVIPSYRTQMDYFKNCTPNIKISDPQIKQILCNALADNIESFEKNRQGFNHIAYSETTIKLEVQYKNGIFPAYRYVYIDETQLKELGNYLNQVDAYKNAYLDLPKADELSIAWNAIADANLSQTDSKKIYETLLKESKEIRFEDWYQAVNSSYSDLSLSGNFIRDGHSYNIEIPLTDALPNTKQAYYKKLNDKNKNSELRNELADVITSYASGLKYESASNVYMLFVDPNSNTVNQVSLSKYLKMSPEHGKETLTLLGNQISHIDQDQLLDFSRPYIIISYQSTGDKNESLDKADYDSDYYNKIKSVSYAIQLDGYDHISNYYPVSGS